MSEKILREFAGLSAGLMRLRGPLTAGLIAFGVLGFLDQLCEVYVILAIDRTLEWPRILIGLFALIALSCLLWGFADQLSPDEDKECQEPLAKTTTEMWTVKVVRVAVGVLPILGVVYGLSRLARQSQAVHLEGIATVLATLKSKPEFGELIAKLPSEFLDGAEHSKILIEVLWISAGGLAVLGVALLSIFGFGRPRLIRDKLRNATVRAPLATSVLGGCCVVLFALQTLNAGQKLPLDFTALPRGLGAAAIVCLFLMCLATALVGLANFRDRHKISAAVVLLLLAFAASHLNLNNNHAVRVIEQKLTWKPSEFVEGTPDAGNIASVRLAFRAWYSARPKERKDVFLAAKKPYPVFIVAAQGGGIYAANLAGLTLAKLYDRCPALKHHLFAVSSVSGGSVGAALVASLLRYNEEALDRPPIETESTSCKVDLPGNQVGPLEQSVTKFLAQDLLSPLVATGLFPDFLQRFIPWPAVGAFDRARAFEASLEETWSHLVDPDRNMMREGFLRHWRPSGPAPMLLLGTTSVDTGRKFAVAPVTFPALIGTSYIGTKSIYFGGLNPHIDDLPMSTAIGISARFPGLMPAADIVAYGNSFATRYADGGYFENSGIETANDLIDSLVALPSIRDANPTPIVFRENAAPASGAENGVAVSLISLNEIGENRPYGVEGFNELMSPVRALYRARVERGRLALARSSRTSASVLINHDYARMTLGWQLAQKTQQQLAAQIGRPSLCLGSERLVNFREAIDAAERGQSDDLIATGRDDVFVDALFKNSCTLCRTLRVVKGLTPFTDRDDQCNELPEVSPAAR